MATRPSREVAFAPSSTCSTRTSRFAQPSSYLKPVRTAVTNRSHGSWRRWTLEPEEFIPAGENVVVPLHIRGQGRESGIEVDAHIVHVWTIRNDRAVKLHVYVDRAEALKAVGLQA